MMRNVQDIRQHDAQVETRLEQGVSMRRSGTARLRPRCHDSPGRSPYPLLMLRSSSHLQVLILAYANEEALRETRRRRVCVLWSTSRHKLWVKGETSGDYLDLVTVLVNCEQNSLLYLVRPRRTGACHTRDHRGPSHILSSRVPCKLSVQAARVYHVTTALLSMTQVRTHWSLRGNRPLCV